jgi:hypothetical protein
MNRKSDGSLVSDNYFAENDLYERMIEIANGRENYIYLSPSSKKYLSEFKEKSFRSGGKVKVGEWKVDKNGDSWVLESIYKADFYNKYDGSYIIYNEKYGTKFIQPSEWKYNYKKSDDYAF